VPRPDIVYCEICGRPVPRREAYIVYLEGTRLVVCPECYSRIARRASKALPYTEAMKRTRTAARRPAPRPASRQRKASLDEFEVVPDYANRVRQARERLGWSQRTLAQAVREGENVIKRIEAGKLTPSIDLAKRLEKVLGIKLLEPVVEESHTALPPAERVKDVTLGDIVIVRKKEEKKG
jgi:putative transcription factor